MRGYFHYKSADSANNRPHPLESWTAEELALMPTYYIIDIDQDMAETVVPAMPSAAEIAACRMAAGQRLAVYAGEYQRNGFQGGLNWYRSRTSGLSDAELRLFSGARSTCLDVHCRQERLGHLSAARQFERMQDAACTACSAAIDRRRRSLGAAGATRAGRGVVRRVSRQARLVS